MIREAHSSDAEAIAGLVTELGYPTTTPSMRERLANLGGVDGATLVFEDDASVVGVIGLVRHPYYELDGYGTEVSVLVVRSDTRGRGVGHGLLQAAEHWAIEHDSRLIWLATGQSREDAHRFYRSAGFHETGTRFSKEIAKSALPRTTG